jgi:Domain of unknown function (DUF6249)
VRTEETIVVMAMFGMIAGVGIIWMAMQNRRHIRELEHRERLAMIERGLMPSPETDPIAFERAIMLARSPESRGTSRMRSAGVMMMALGIGFMFLLTFTAGEPGVGIGVGGAFAILGVAFFINSSLMSRPNSYSQLPPRPVSSVNPERKDS